MEIKSDFIYDIDDKLKINIASKEDAYMSNWEATHMFDSLNISNNKFNILEQINKYIEDGGEKKSIFIFDASFNINTSYIKYFNNGNILSLNNNKDLKNTIYMGKIIPLEYNEKLTEIQYIFNFFEAINLALKKLKHTEYKKLSLNINILRNAINMISQVEIDRILEFIYDNSKDLVNKIPLDNDELNTNKINTLLQNLTNIYNKSSRAYINFQHESINKTNSRFMENFKSFYRPIIGIYNPMKNEIEILNYKQMYLKGEQFENDIGLISIKRNSPIQMDLSTIGIMTSMFKYLYLSEYHSEANETDFSIPTEEEFLNNLLLNKDSDMFFLSKQLLLKTKKLISNKKVFLKIYK